MCTNNDETVIGPYELIMFTLSVYQWSSATFPSVSWKAIKPRLQLLKLLNGHELITLTQCKQAVWI